MWNRWGCLPQRRRKPTHDRWSAQRSALPTIQHLASLRGDAGMNPGAQDDPHVADFVQYLEVEKHASPHTVDNYLRDIRQFAALQWPDDAPPYSWQGIDRFAARRFLVGFQKAGRSPGRAVMARPPPERDDDEPVTSTSSRSKAARTRQRGGRRRQGRSPRRLFGSRGQGRCRERCPRQDRDVCPEDRSSDDGYRTAAPRSVPSGGLARSAADGPSI